MQRLENIHQEGADDTRLLGVLASLSLQFSFFGWIHNFCARARVWQFLKELDQFLEELDLTEHKYFWFVKDTIGLFYIRFPKDETDLDRGLAYLRKAEETEKDSEKICRAFKKYHEYLAIKQIARIRRTI